MSFTLSNDETNKGWRGWLLTDTPHSRLQARLGRAYLGWRSFARNPLAMAGLIIFVILVLMAIFASMNVERTERGDEMFAVMAERPAWQALDLDSLSLL